MKTADGLKYLCEVPQPVEDETSKIPDGLNFDVEDAIANGLKLLLPLRNICVNTVTSLFFSFLLISLVCGNHIFSYQIDDWMVVV